MNFQQTTSLTFILLGLASGVCWAEPALEPGPSYNRQIRPLLAAKCFACHGPDEEKRQADLRLDVRAAAMEQGALSPGKPDESELLRRVFSDDPDEQMPPPESHEVLSAAEKNLLRRWIDSGAKYEAHWSFTPPQRPELPPDNGWSKHPIDRFTWQRMKASGLAPSPKADRYALIRRVYFDLIGLPPTPEEADTFVANDDPQAYAKIVDRLLASKKYGERWARQWLDLARYSDTNGYEKDRPRSIWPYRDWVIRSLNADKPFSEFTIEQLAGDMLPKATLDQRIATGFHRNTMLNEEGGIDPLEYRFYAMVDRVATTGTVWLGLTTGCAQCHSHKYDPISHTDYYRLMALLNNADEPDLTVPDKPLQARRKSIEDQVAKLRAQLPESFPPASGDGKEADRRKRHYEDRLREWTSQQQSAAVDWTILRPVKLSSNLPRLEPQPDGSIISSGDITKRDVYDLTFQIPQGASPATALRLEVLPDSRLPAGGPGRAYYEGRKGDFFLSELTAAHDGKPIALEEASHSFGKISIGNGDAKAANILDGEGSTGWSTSGKEGEANWLVVNFSSPQAPGSRFTLQMLFERHFAASLGRFRISFASADKTLVAGALSPEVETVLALPPEKRTPEQRQSVREAFHRAAPELSEARQAIDTLQKQMPDLPHTMVMQERPAGHRRATHRHHRGEFLSPKELVTPGAPAFLPALPADEPADRLTFARWLVDGKNPLVARVVVNRAWRAFFGAGLVRSSGDFGVQADSPTHPQLLDWLATELVADGWSMKRLHRLIVTSETYRQSALVGSDRYASDPENRLLARGPRNRLEAEMLRDAMLQASGLLSPKMYGPGVFPPQPKSVSALAYGNYQWKPSTGEDRYRRSLYTFSKRTAPFAAFTVFDAPTGENCIARRDRSNTPLQALTLLNDAMFLEMAQALAKQAMKQHPDSETHCATAIFRTFLTRPPTTKEQTKMLAFVHEQQQRLTQGDLAAEQINGDKNKDIQLAAWTMLARVIMNLDEAVSR